MANLGRLTMFQRLDMYVQVVGKEYVAAAWDLARTQMPDDDHRELAGWLGGALGRTDGEPLPVAPEYDPHAPDPLLPMEDGVPDEGLPVDFDEAELDAPAPDAGVDVEAVL